jgi:hypothetical protein
MLYLEKPTNTFTEWAGELINSVRYPSNIEQLWTAEALAAIGLYVPADPGIPAGKVANGFAVARVNGVVTKVYALSDAPPEPLPALAPYQFRSMLALSGKAAQLDSFMDGLTDPAKTIAKAKLEYSLAFHRDNDLIDQARQAMGLSNSELDALWEQAAAIT